MPVKLMKLSYAKQMTYVYVTRTQQRLKTLQYVIKEYLTVDLSFQSSGLKSLLRILEVKTFRNLLSIHTVLESVDYKIILTFALTPTLSQLCHWKKLWN